MTFRRGLKVVFHALAVAGAVEQLGLDDAAQCDVIGGKLPKSGAGGARSDG
jgi:hypothetical protein